MGIFFYFFFVKMETEDFFYKYAGTPLKLPRQNVEMPSKSQIKTFSQSSADWYIASLYGIFFELFTLIRYTWI